MKSKRRKMYWMTGVAVMTAAMALGFRMSADRRAPGVAHDQTYLYKAAALFNNQNYVPF